MTDFESTRAIVVTHTRGKIKVGSKDRMESWKETDGQTDTTDRITFPANAVSNNQILSVVLTFAITVLCFSCTLKTVDCSTIDITLL